MRVQDQEVTFKVFKTIKHPSDSNECFSINVLNELTGSAFGKMFPENTSPTLELKPLPDHIRYAFLASTA